MLMQRTRMFAMAYKTDMAQGRKPSKLRFAVL
jgi:hypothetical protein